MKNICLLLNYFCLGAVVEQLPTSLPPPMNIQGSKLKTTNYITVSWEWDARQCSNATFEIRYKTTGAWSLIQQPLGGRKFRHTNVRADTHYYYSIRVHCNGMSSEWSNVNDYGIAIATGAVTTASTGFVYGGHPTPQTHKAFVIGNRYYDVLDTMLGADMSARKMRELLENFNWGVTGSENLMMKQSFENEINRFLRTVQSKDTVLLYYAGYGVRYAGKNYLLPKGSQFKAASDVLTQGYSLDTLLQKLGRSRTATVTILDLALPNTGFVDFEPIQLSVYEHELGIVRHNKLLSNRLLPFTERLVTKIARQPCVSMGGLLEQLQSELEGVTYFNRFVRPFSLHGCD